MALVVNRGAIRRPLGAPQSLGVLPTNACLQMRGLLRVASLGSEQRLCGDEFRTANVASWPPV
jgi:hypothetical protein